MFATTESWQRRSIGLRAIPTSNCAYVEVEKSTIGCLSGLVRGTSRMALPKERSTVTMNPISSIPPPAMSHLGQLRAFLVPRTARSRVAPALPQPSLPRPISRKTATPKQPRQHFQPGRKICIACSAALESTSWGIPSPRKWAPPLSGIACPLDQASGSTLSGDARRISAVHFVARFSSPTFRASLS